MTDPITEAIEATVAPVVTWNQQETEVEFTFTEGGKWYRTWLACTDYLTLLQTGMLEGRSIAAVKVIWVVDPENVAEVGQCNFVHDFILAKRGLPAWRIYQS